MRTLRNFTLHCQTANQIRLAAWYGLLLRIEPEGVEINPGIHGLEKAALELAVKLADCAGSGDAALIGGHTGLWIAALDSIRHEQWPRPDLRYFDTKREPDENGRLVFRPVGLVTLPNDKFVTLRAHK